MLTSKVTRKIEIPHEPGQWMEFRVLSGRQLDEAQEARSKKSFAMMRELNGIDLHQRDDAAPVETKPTDLFDIDVLLSRAIQSWSYDEPFAVTLVDDLDQTTRNWAARAILEMSQDTSEARGNA